jgi:hypothetical protein
MMLVRLHSVLHYWHQCAALQYTDVTYTVAVAVHVAVHNNNSTLEPVTVAIACKGQPMVSHTYQMFNNLQLYDRCTAVFMIQHLGTAHTVR